MRVVIDNDFEVEDLDHEAFSLLKECTVFHTTDGSLTRIHAQKVDLNEEKMEDFLDVISTFSSHLIHLERYAYGRYGLVLK